MTNKPIDASVISQTSLPEEVQQGLPVETVGKSEDIRSRRGLTRVSHQTPAGVDAEGWESGENSNKYNFLFQSQPAPPRIEAERKPGVLQPPRYGAQVWPDDVSSVLQRAREPNRLRQVPISLKVFYADDATFEQAETRCDGMAPVDGSTACVNP
ncbi:ribosomal protein RPS29 [Toxoplasma gondii VAND]|uniref:Ribosomal protein RPS29 n=1 Tax=Toxoplasma gondii VAND TaxID=933077 RepID=A0A086PX82_TOXGO|nr:ribosomal protein RPS29 [Toxoplasma gondii VAND]